MNTYRASKIAILTDRAFLLRKARAFFTERNILEVDCPALSHAAPIDLHIDVMTVTLSPEEKGYLHTSAEYGMKRLLALGMGNIFQISHVFRSGEVGPLHNPEFTMVEWYRLAYPFPELMEETVDFICLFLGDTPTSYLRYRDAFLHYLHIDYTVASCSDLLTTACNHGMELSKDAERWEKDTLLQLLFSFLIEPQLGKEQLHVIYDFPASQAALAKIQHHADEEIALRFEVYYKGIELANGYDELTDPQEQRKRLERANQARIATGKNPLKMDENFLKALYDGLPDCCGVAVGFDRLMMLRHQKEHLHHILPFSWEDT